MSAILFLVSYRKKLTLRTVCQTPRKRRSCHHIEALWRQPLKSKIPVASLVDFLRVQSLPTLVRPLSMRPSYSFAHSATPLVFPLRKIQANVHAGLASSVYLTHGGSDDYRPAQQHTRSPYLFSKEAVTDWYFFCWWEKFTLLRWAHRAAVTG